MTLLIVLVFILITLSVWNLINLYDLKKFNRSKFKIEDDRYFELKYKLEFITTIAIVVIGVGGFFGYKVSDEINLRADKLKTRLDSLDSLIVAKKDTLYTYDKKAKKLNNSFEELANKITVIGNKNIVKQDFYITDNIKFPFLEKKPDTVSFYFKNLKTLAGDPYPVFDKTPFLVIVPENGAPITLLHLDKYGFDVSCYEWNWEIDSVMFGIMVSKK